MTADIWVSLALLLPGAFITLVLHELAHCVVVWAKGLKVTGFYPFPHLKDGKGGIFFWPRKGLSIRWAGMKYDGRNLTNEAWMTFIIILRASIFLVAWALLAIFFYWPLAVLAFWELTDVINWVQGYFRPGSNNDGKRFRRATQW